MRAPAIRKLARAATLLCAVGLSTGRCRPPPVTPTARVADLPSFRTTLEDARARSASLVATAAPAFVGEPTMETAKRYMSEQFAPWSQAIVRRFREEVTAAYARAAALAPTAEAEIDVIAEAYDVSVRLTQIWVNAAARVMPASWRDMPDVAGAFTGRMESYGLRYLQQDTLARCVDRADQTGATTRSAERCRAALKDLRVKLAAGTSGNAESAHAPASPGSPPVEPWVATREVRPCVFTGTGRFGDARLYAERTGGRPVGRLRADARLRVGELELPRHAGERYRIDIAWPVQGTLWLSADAKPIRLDTRVELVDQHIWRESGSGVGAASANGQAQLDLMPPVVEEHPASGDPHHVRTFEAPGIRLGRSSESQTRACSSLRLAGEDDDPVQPDGQLTDIPDDVWIPLFAGAHDPRAVAWLRGGFAWSTGQDDGRSHVVARWPGFGLDGWIPSSSVRDDRAQGHSAGLGMIGLIRLGYDGAKEVRAGTRGLPVRLLPDSKAPVIFSVPPGGRVFLGNQVGDFYRMDVIDLAASVESGLKYFVSVSAIELPPTQ